MNDDPRMQSIAEALCGDNEFERADAGPKEPYGRASYRGVIIASRFRIKIEFELMRRAIDAMPEALARRVETIWCDSKNDGEIAVGVKPGLFGPDLAGAIGVAFRAAGGHGGITVYGGEGQIEDVGGGEPGERAMVA